MTPLASQNAVSSALPSWIDETLLAETKAVWSPFYGHELTTTEALEILMSVGRIVDTLQESSP